MGARPTTFRKGGGFLNNVDGTWVDYTFTDDSPNGEPFKPGKVKGADGKMKDRFHSLFCRISVLPDGAEEPVQTSLFVGGADDFKVSEDGKEIWDAEYGTPEEAEEAGDAARGISANSAIAILVGSACEAGFPQDRLSETRIDFQPMLGWRYRFVQKRDDEATKKLGKRKDKKSGKEYDRNNLVIDQTYGEAEEATAAPSKPAKAGKPVTTAKPVAGKPAGKPAKVNVEELAAKTLQGILAKNGGSVAKKKVNMAVLQALMKDPARDDVQKWLFDDDNLAGLDGVTYNKKTGIITADEAEAEESDE